MRKLAVRGRERVKVAVYLKALACNVKRAAVYLGQLALGGTSKAKAPPPPAFAAAEAPDPTREGDCLVARSGT